MSNRIAFYVQSDLARTMDQSSNFNEISLSDSERKEEKYAVTFGKLPVARSMRRSSSFSEEPMRRRSSQEQ